jgi:prepilin-type N-terminal cleavage/methylation domain-containing protein
MNKTKAFTFIELIVSVTIMAIIWTSGMFYFHEFIWKKELLTHLNSFENVIWDLDYQVKKQNIFDYQLKLEKNTIWYTISQNNIWTDFTQEAVFDSLNNSWSINIIEDSNEIWELKVYQWWKKIEQLTRNWSDNISIELEENTTITSSLSWSRLNTLSFNYFTQDEDDNFVILDILDNNMTSYDSLTIRNISGKKSYLDESSQINNLPIILLFEQNWIEERLELN